MGMHVKWIKDRRQKDVAGAPTQGPSSPPVAKIDYSSSSDFSLGSSPGRPAQKSSTSSGSYASTTSSFLVRYFPKRYFILKSLNEADLKLSVQSSVWATQHHNEGILDQAFQTSKAVYLLFSAHTSGAIFGYARMTGPIRPGERRVSWASRSESGLGAPLQSSIVNPTELSNIEERLTEPSAAFLTRPLLSPSEHRMASSPSVLTPEDDLAEGELHLRRTSKGTPRNPITNTAPEPAHDKLSFSLAVREHGTLDPRNLDFSTLPVPAAKPELTVIDSVSRHNRGKMDADGVVRKDTLVTSGQTTISSEQSSRKANAVDGHPRSSAGHDTLPTGPPDQKEVWGNPFPIEWIRTDRLSFQRTRHLRNPWNHDREVKVSRDGTELEPSVGEALLAEWEKIRTLTPPPTSEDPIT